MTHPFPPRLVRASAGSGKTCRLVHRFIGLLAAGVEPRRILDSRMRSHHGDRRAAAVRIERAQAEGRLRAPQPGWVRLAARSLGGSVLSIFAGLH